MKIAQNNGTVYIHYDEFNSSLFYEGVRENNSLVDFPHDLQIGLEFEFYLGDGTKGSHDESFDFLIKHQFKYLFERLAFLQDGNEHQKKEGVWYLERDNSLVSFSEYGYELVSPILTVQEASFYINSITSLIKSFGFTNNECGLHVHLSSPSRDKINPIALCLTSRECFNAWESRGEFVKSLYSKFKLVSPDIFEKYFHDLSKNLNITSRCKNSEDNHIEIRAMGGAFYEERVEEICNNLNNFVKNSYLKSCDAEFVNSGEYKGLLKEHFVLNQEHFGEPVSFDDICSGIKRMFDDVLNREERIETAVLILNEYDKLDKFVPFYSLLNEVMDFERTYEFEKIDADSKMIASLADCKNLELD